MRNPRTAIALFAYGDIHPPTHQCLVRDLVWAAKRTAARDTARRLVASGVDLKGEAERLEQEAWDVQAFAPPEDALISRARARAAQAFLQTDHEVLIMVDHDIEWLAPRDGYEGDLLHLARQCARTKAIVGAVVAKKNFGAGTACVWSRSGDFKIGLEAHRILEPVHWVGSGLTAYHRDVLQGVYDSMEVVIPGYAPIFDTLIVEHPCIPGQKVQLSEDWAFCVRAREILGTQSYVALRCFTRHWGRFPYDVKTIQMDPTMEN